MTWERILIALTFIICATGFTWVALKAQAEQRELDEYRRTNVAPPIANTQEYLWQVVFQRAEGQLDTMEVTTHELDEDFGILEVANDRLFVTIDGGGHMNYQAIDVARLVEIKLIAD